MTQPRWDQNLRIEHSGRHDSQAVERLRALLADTDRVHEDPQRRDFYEIHDDVDVYYIYASPTSGKVYLLATWQKQYASATA